MNHLWPYRSLTETEVEQTITLPGEDSRRLSTVQRVADRTECPASRPRPIWRNARPLADDRHDLTPTFRATESNRGRSYAQSKSRHVMPAETFNPFREPPEEEIHSLRSALGDERLRDPHLADRHHRRSDPAAARYADLPGAPEAFRATVEQATGFNGGNHSHGGVMRVSFATGRGDNFVGWKHDTTRDEQQAILTAKGDLEQAGLVDALAGLLAELLPIYHRRE